MNYISLGYFCSIASELERYGLRTQSSPFDWVISDFEGVLMAIRFHFADFLKYELLYQSKECHSHYRNNKYGINFYHDFDKYLSLEKQLPKVKQKYDRRIERFYKTISQPTLFIRYISDEVLVDGVSKELIYIENNYDDIINLIKSFNPDNDILFIANKGVSSDKISIFKVEKDNEDVVAREPFSKNDDLYNIFSNAYLPNKQVNIDRYIAKERKRTSIPYRLRMKINKTIKNILLSEYVHHNQY